MSRSISAVVILEAENKQISNSALLFWFFCFLKPGGLFLAYNCGPQTRQQNLKIYCTWSFSLHCEAVFTNNFSETDVIKIDKKDFMLLI